MRITVESEVDFAPTSQPKPRQNPISAVLVHLDAVHVAIRPDFTLSRAFRHADHGRERSGLRPHLTAKAEAKSAVDASAAAGTRLGKNRHWRRIRMVSQLSGSTLEEDSRAFDRQRRHGIRLRSRRIE